MRRYLEILRLGFDKFTFLMRRYLEILRLGFDRLQKHHKSPMEVTFFNKIGMENKPQM